VLRADATAAALSVVLAMLVFAAGMVVLIRGVTRPLERLNRFAQRVAEGDLTEAPDGAPGNDEVGRLQVALCTMTERLRTLLASLRNASEELSGAAAILDRSTEDQTSLLQQQAGFLQEVNTTTREVEQTSAAASHRAETVLVIARDATEYSRSGQTSAGESLAKAQEIRQYMQAIVARSSELGEQARQAGEIVESVKDFALASQILSLNASLEAARAGEAGRGFAVVANEVRALAEQSGQSATRIGKIVEDIGRAVGATMEMTEQGNRGIEAGIERIRASGESLKEIGAFIGTTSEAALQIAGAVKQQTAGVGQIATAIADLDARMQDAVRGIETVRQAAAKLTATSASIRSVVSQFRA
jgi:methyl-accepting chemotaxis protein